MILKKCITICCLFAAVCGYADYKVELTFSNGATRSVKNLVIQDGVVILAKENLKIPVSQVKSARFTIEEALRVSECAVLIKRGAYEDLLSQVDAFLKPVEHGLVLKSNLDVFVQYKMKALFRLDRFEEALVAAESLRSKQSQFSPVADAYVALITLEQGAPAAEVTNACLSMGESFGAIKEYIRGRLAMNMKMYEVALQHFSNVLVFYERDPEWVTAASFYEGLIYKKTGYLEQAAGVAAELKIAYPDGYWSRRADELK
jgi:tetratricopeptide (TPR) repeat protein